MAGSILNGKRILAVDDEPDVLEVLEEEILDACPDCTLTRPPHTRKRTGCEDKAYDCHPRHHGVRGFDLLDRGP